MAKKVYNSIVSSNTDSIVSAGPPSEIIDEKNPDNILKFENLISGFSAALVGALEDSLENELGQLVKKIC